MKMKNLITGYYAADTTNGVTFHGICLESGFGDTVGAEDFAASLSDLKDDETIYAHFEDENEMGILAKIEADYGIH